MRKPADVLVSEVKNETVASVVSASSMATESATLDQIVSIDTSDEIREVQVGDASNVFTNIVVAVARDRAPSKESRSSSVRASNARTTIYEEVEQSADRSVSNLRKASSQDPEEFSGTDRIENVGSTLVSKLLTGVKALAANIVSFGKTTSGETITSSADRKVSVDSDVADVVDSITAKSVTVNGTVSTTSDAPTDEDQRGRSESEAVSVSTASFSTRLAKITVSSAVILSITPAIAGVTSIAVSLALITILVAFGLIRGPTAQITAKYNNNNQIRGLSGLRALLARISARASIISGGASWLLSILNQTFASLTSSKYRKASASLPAAAKQQRTRSDYISSQTQWSMSTVRTVSTTLGTGLLASVSTLFGGLSSKLWKAVRYLSTQLKASTPTSIKRIATVAGTILLLPSTAMAQDTAATGVAAFFSGLTFSQVATYLLMAAVGLLVLWFALGMFIFVYDSITKGMMRAMRLNKQFFLTLVLASMLTGMAGQMAQSSPTPHLPQHEETYRVGDGSLLLPPRNWTPGDPLGVTTSSDRAEIESPVRVVHAGDHTPVADRWTYENNGLQFYTMRDLSGRPGSDNAWVDADAALRADILGQVFFDLTGKRVGVNRLDGPDDQTWGIRRGTRIDSDNPGVAGSRHLHGQAFDFQTAGLTDREKALFLELGLRLGFRGIGFYEHDDDGYFIHMDIGSRRTWTGNDTATRPSWADPVMRDYNTDRLAFLGDPTRAQLITHIQTALADRNTPLPERSPLLVGGPGTDDQPTDRSVTATGPRAGTVGTGGEDEPEEVYDVVQRPIAEVRAELLASSIIRSDSHGDGYFGASRTHGTHDGIDIAGPLNSQIAAPWSGTVVRAEDSGNGYGKVVEIQTTIDGRTISVFYAHLASISVQEGTTVHRRDIIGTIGSTGNAGGTDPHVHFEIRVDGSIINPTDIVARAYERVPLKNTGLSGLMTLGSLSLLDVATQLNIDRSIVLARPDVLSAGSFDPAPYRPVTEPYVSRLEPQLLAAVRATYDGDTALINRHFGNFDNFVRFIEQVIMAESSFDNSQVSDAGAVGYMQLMLPAYTDARNAIGAGWGEDDRTDPVKNIRAGTWYMVRQLERFGTIEGALAAYNDGPGDAAVYLPDTDRAPRETRNYIARIMAGYNEGYVQPRLAVVRSGDQVQGQVIGIDRTARGIILTINDRGTIFQMFDTPLVATHLQIGQVVRPGEIIGVTDVDEYVQEPVSVTVSPEEILRQQLQLEARRLDPRGYTLRRVNEVAAEEGRTVFPVVDVLLAEREYMYVETPQGHVLQAGPTMHVVFKQGDQYIAITENGVATHIPQSIRDLAIQRLDALSLNRTGVIDGQNGMVLIVTREALRLPTAELNRLQLRLYDAFTEYVGTNLYESYILTLGRDVASRFASPDGQFNSNGFLGSVVADGRPTRTVEPGSDASVAALEQLIANRRAFLDQVETDLGQYGDNLRPDDRLPQWEQQYRLGVIEGMIRQYEADPATAIASRVNMYRQLTGANNNTARVRAFAGIGPAFSPANGLSTSFDIGGGLSLNLGVLMDNRYASQLETIRQLVGVQDISSMSNVNQFFAYLSLANQIVEFRNAIVRGHLQFDERGGIVINSDAPGVVRALIGERSTLRADPHIAKNERGEWIFTDTDTGTTYNLGLYDTVNDIPRFVFARLFGLLQSGRQELVGESRIPLLDGAENIVSRLSGGFENRYVWDPYAYRAVPIPSNAQLQFMLAGMMNDNPELVFFTIRGIPGEFVDGDPTKPSEQYLFGYSLNTRTGEFREYFRSHMYATDDSGEMWINEALQDVRFSMFRNEPGQTFVIPSRHQFRQLGEYMQLYRGETHDGRKILAAAVNPVNGEIIRFYFEGDRLPPLEDAEGSVRTYERNGQTIYVGPITEPGSNDPYQSRVDVHPGIIVGDDRPAYILYSRHAAELGYWTFRDNDPEDRGRPATAFIELFDAATGEFLRTVPYYGDQSIPTRALRYAPIGTLDDQEALRARFGIENLVTVEGQDRVYFRPILRLPDANRDASRGPKELILPEGFRIVAPGYTPQGESAPLVGANQIGIVVERPDRVPTHRIDFPSGSIYIYPGDLDYKITTEAGSEFGFAAEWANGRRVQFIDPSHTPEGAKDDRAVVVMTGFGEIGRLESGPNARNIFEEMIDYARRNGDTEVYGVTISGGQIDRYITSGGFAPLTREITVVRPLDERTPLERFLMTADVSAANVATLMERMGYGDGDPTIIAQILRLNGIADEVDRLTREIPTATRLQDELTRRLAEIERRLSNNQSIEQEVRAINTLLRQFVEEQAKIEGGIALEGLFDQIATSMGISVDELKREIRAEGGSNATIGATIRRLIDQRFSGGLFNPRDIEFLGLMARANAQYNANTNAYLNSDGEVPASEFYAFNESATGGTSVDDKIRAARAGITEAEQNIAALREKLATGGLTWTGPNGEVRRYLDLLQSREELARGYQFYFVDDGQSGSNGGTRLGRIARLQSEFIPFWQGEVTRTRAGTDERQFAQNMLAFVQAELQGALHEAQLVRDQQYVYDVLDRYPELNRQIGTLPDGTPVINGVVLFTPQELIQRQIAAQTARISQFNTVIGLMETSKTVLLPNFVGVPQGQDELLRSLGIDPAQLQGIPFLSNEQAQRFLLQIDTGEADRVLRAGITRMQQALANPDLSDAARGLAQRLMTNLQSEIDLNHGLRRELFLEYIRFYQKVAAGQTVNIDEILRLSNQLRDVESTLWTERAGLLQEFNRLGFDVLNQEAADAARRVSELEREFALNNLNTVLGRVGIGRNPLEGILDSLSSYLDAQRQRLDENAVYQEARRGLQIQVQETQRVIRESREATIRYNAEIDRLQTAILQYVSEHETDPRRLQLVSEAVTSYFRQLKRSLPAEFMEIGGVIYYNGVPVSAGIVMNGTPTIDFATGNVTRIAGVNETVISAEQVAMYNAMQGIDAYIGSVRATVPGADNNRYAMVMIDATDPRNANLLAQFGIGIQQAAGFDIDAGSVADGGSPQGTPTSQYVGLLISSAAYRSDDGRLFAGVVGAIRFQDSDNYIAAVDGRLDYRLTPQSKVILEIGVARAQGTGEVTFNAIDPLTGATLVNEARLYSVRDTLDRQRLSYELSLGNHGPVENLTMTLSINRVHEGSFQDLFEEQTQVFGSVGVRANIGEVTFSVEQGIGADRTAVNVGYGRFNVNYSRINGFDQYGVTARIIETEAVRTSVSIQRDVRGNLTFSVNGRAKIVEGVDAVIGADGNGRFSAGIVADILTLAFGSRDDNAPKYLSRTVEQVIGGEQLMAIFGGSSEVRRYDYTIDYTNLDSIRTTTMRVEEVTLGTVVHSDRAMDIELGLDGPDSPYAGIARIIGAQSVGLTEAQHDPRHDFRHITT